MIFLLPLVLLFAGCHPSIEHKVTGNVAVDPVTIEHRIILDTSLLYDYYIDECTASGLTVEADIKNCADTKLNSFIQNFTKTN